MADYKQGIKKEVAEIKFLIHDLRIERFINEIIHFHVTLNTDLEIYSMEQAQILHGEDLHVLKTKAVALRRAFQEYFNAAKSFSPDRTVLAAGRRYVDTIYSMCELILNPLWGRIDKVLTFLPEESRSVRSHKHYRNCIQWIDGVRDRIRHFLDELENEDLYLEFDISKEIESFTHNVLYGYVEEKSSDGVAIELGRLDSAIVGGNRYRLKRMYFNLVMNAVDAMEGRKDGRIDVSEVIEDDRVVLRVSDNGGGMTAEKQAQLLRDRETLDGELHSLGFVFVRQTIEAFNGELSVESEIGKGTTITVRLPYLYSKEGQLRTGGSEQSSSGRTGGGPASMSSGAAEAGAGSEDVRTGAAAGAPESAGIDVGAAAAGVRSASVVGRPAAAPPAPASAAAQPAAGGAVPASSGVATAADGFRPLGSGAPRAIGEMRPALSAQSAAATNGRSASARDARSTPVSEAPPAAADGQPAAGEPAADKACGAMIYRAYEISEAQFPGSIFSISVNAEGKVDLFTHRAYERYFEITHEDLTPMFVGAVVRGRLEPDADRRPLLTLKAPQNARDFFDFKNVPDAERSAEKHVQLLRDEYINIARKLVATGLDGATAVVATDIPKCFPDEAEIRDCEPFPLELLAAQKLTSEKSPV